MGQTSAFGAFLDPVAAANAKMPAPTALRLCSSKMESGR
ncbi:hypothetical protein, partial [Chromobacterium phragmitis]